MNAMFDPAVAEYTGFEDPSSVGEPSTSNVSGTTMASPPPRAAWGGDPGSSFSFVEGHTSTVDDDTLPKITTLRDFMASISLGRAEDDDEYSDVEV